VKGQDFEFEEFQAAKAIVLQRTNAKDFSA